MNGSVHVQAFRSRGRSVGRVRRPAVGVFEQFHGQTLALVEVVRFVAAQDLGEGVRVGGFAARGAPRVVAAVAELHVLVDAREGGSARIDARTVQVLLEQDLGRVVADLRAHDGERMCVAGVRRADELPVRVVPGLVQEASADRAVAGDPFGGE